jgi:hypothetical protein
MPVALYMDVHIPRAITLELRLHGVDVITAQEDNALHLFDPELLDRATVLGRALFTFDDDLLKEAKRRQAADIPFGGVIYARLLQVSIGLCVRDLEIIAKAGEPAEMAGRVEYLPL